MTSEQPARIVPISLREKQERYAHVAQRLLERGGITWTLERVEVLEKKIKQVRTMVNQCKPVPNILPTKIGEEKDGQVHFYRILIAGQPHTVVWSQIARGLVSYRGPGELKEPTPIPEKTS